MIAKDFQRIPEPTNPMQAARLTPFEREMLIAQRQLDNALSCENKEDVKKALCRLGHFEAAGAKDLVEACSAEKCNCSSQELTIEGQVKKMSPLQPIQEFPQGMLYRCLDCGHQLINPNFPDDLTRLQHEARVTFPEKGRGSDSQVLTNR